MMCHYNIRKLLNYKEFHKLKMDFSKLYCCFHPQQIVTNYCNKQQCQVALCANCICIHTKMHMQKGSSPNYQNIRSTYKYLAQQINSTLKQLEDVQYRIGIVQNKIVQKRQKLKEVISQGRSQTLNLINKIFDSKEEQLIREIQAKQKKYGLHCKSRLENLKNCITRQTSNLKTIIQNLNHYNFLESVAKIKMQTLHNSQALRQQFSQQVRQNQLFDTLITCNKNCFNQIGEVLNKIIILNIGKGLITVPEQKTYFKNINQKEPKNNFYNPNYNSGWQQPKLFTLRRPSSQESQTTIGYQQRKQTQYPSYQTWIYAYPQDNNSLNTLIKKKVNEYRSNLHDTAQNKLSSFAKQIQTQKSSQIKLDQNKHQADQKNYDFTFGNQFKQIPRPALKQSLANQVNHSGISEKIKGNFDGKIFNPCFVSNFQQKQINNSIKKMQKKSQKFSKYLQNSEKDKEYSQDSSQNFKQFMYRTQLL